MLVVGLTGGIASGKSRVSAAFERLGIDVIDTDLISRELVEPGSPLLDLIETRLGSGLINSDGELERGKLRELIFADTDKRATLESLLHPAIRDEVNQRIAACSTGYVIVVIPLLVETRYPYALDRVLVVDAPEQLQLERLMQRDGMNEDGAKRALASQATREERLAIADDVITNDGGLETLEQAVRTLDARYRRIAAGHVAR